MLCSASVYLATDLCCSGTEISIFFCKCIIFLSFENVLNALFHLKTVIVEFILNFHISFRAFDGFFWFIFFKLIFFSCSFQILFTPSHPWFIPSACQFTSSLQLSSTGVLLPVTMKSL